ncbi:VOC family protein [Nocardia aurantia]|uniref:VOC family protein n=1 Tax=Nocardia aurantia TaxID=2585199 RepID=UPI0029E817CD|nr:VOC family protein [Nocardia aurantia]
MTRLDHLVLATPHLSETVQLVTRLLGVAPVAGGRHPGLGTRNFLLGLGDGGYLELIGPDPAQPTPDRPRPFGIDELPQARLVTWAVAVPDIDAAIDRARAAGYDPGDAREMSRTTPAGDTLRWRLTAERAGGPGGTVPFLIDWGTTAHPAQDLPEATLESLVAIGPDPTTVSERLHALGAELPVRPGLRNTLLATVIGPAGPITLH